MKGNQKRVARMSRPARIAVALFGLGLLSIIMLSTSVVVAQTPSSAISHFKSGIKENEKNNFDRAIEEFSIAIEISSHPWQPRAGRRVTPQRLTVKPNSIQLRRRRP